MFGKDKQGNSLKGTSRVAIRLATGIIHSYTLEAHYSQGTLGDKSYTIGNFQGVGKGLADALCEMHGLHPCTKLRKPLSLEKMRENITKELLTKRTPKLKKPEPEPVMTPIVKTSKMDKLSTAPLPPVKTP